MSELKRLQVEQLLKDRGLSKLLPVHFLARRTGCEVWGGNLFTTYGDAAAQIQVYAFCNEPESIVDFEEEITALTDESGSRRVLVRELRDEDWGILITCAAEDSTIFERFFAEAEPPESSITYHPQLDRILGGDYFHQIQERWAKACLSSLERAMQINSLLEDAEKAYEGAPGWPGKLDQPLPALLAVLQIPAIPLEGAPVGYSELVLMHFVIESPEVIAMSPAKGKEELTSFARQLFSLLRVQHGCGICFSRDAGSCLRPEFLLRNGALTDVYFIARPDNRNTLNELRKRDLWNALVVTCELAEGDIHLASVVLREATARYTAKTRLAKGVEELIESAVGGVLSGYSEGLRALTYEIMR
jgi:hypothetical protein